MAATATRSPAEGSGGAPPARAYRFAGVFVLVLALCVFLILAPDTDWAHSIAIGLLSAALIVVVATSRASAAVRRARALAALMGAVVLTLMVAFGVLGDVPLFVIATAMSLAIPLTLVGGLMRLIRTRGVTLQAVIGALTIYVLLGLVFSWLIGIVAHVGDQPFFSDGTDGTVSEHVYFSFTALTTTGFGDLAAGTQSGRALVLIEMLSGQLYLVTVIGVLIGSFGRR
ncbi:MAG TPA: ion channel [Solirubrobacter sp.]|nr:ion channel [Solirubrobacter sp.]